MNTAIADINAIRDRAFGADLNDLDPASDAATVLSAQRVKSTERRPSAKDGNSIRPNSAA